MAIELVEGVGAEQSPHSNQNWAACGIVQYFAFCSFYVKPLKKININRVSYDWGGST